MINSLGVIENPPSLDRLLKFKPNQEVRERLSYLDIPLVEDETATVEKEDEDGGSSGSSVEAIKERDKVLFATHNTENISCLVFYVYNETDFFTHHDAYVFSTILDSALIDSSGRCPLVALATCEKDIFVYDFSLEFPVLPQFLFAGHKGPVCCLKTRGSVLWSAGDDGQLIEWDLERLGGTAVIVPKDSKNYGMPIECFDIAGSHLAYGADRSLKINGESVVIENKIEKLVIESDLVYVADETGDLVIYDPRNLKEPFFSKKLHDSAIFDLVFRSDTLVTASGDGLVKTWSKNGMKETGCYERASPVWSLCFDSEGKLFCGDDEETVSVLDLPPAKPF